IAANGRLAPRLAGWLSAATPLAPPAIPSPPAPGRGSPPGTTPPTPAPARPLPRSRTSPPPPAAWSRRGPSALRPPAARARLAAVQALRESVPADGVVFTDMTQLAYLGNYAFPAERPGLWFHPSGYGALGFALPAALGAKIAQPQRPVVALAGDFGVQFT